MKRKKVIGEFSEALIRKYLDARVYEKRGWTREQYIKKCKDIWRETKYDPEYEKKIIIDFSEPVTVPQLFGFSELEVDFADDPLIQAPVHWEEKHDIECLVMLSARRPQKGGKIERVKIGEAFKPAERDVDKDSSEQRPYVVALFDVLGFSKLVIEMGSKKLLDTYQRLVETVIKSEGYTAFGRVKLGANYTIGGSYTPIKYAYFSDTILLWTSANDTYVSPFLARCADLICEALKIGMPLRGSICFGEAVMNKTTNTFIGGAIVEASDIEKNQKWVGATLGAAFLLPELRDAVSEALIVPLFCDHYKDEMPSMSPYLTLDWVTRWKTKNYPDLVSTLEALREKAPEKNKAYYDNTIKFAHYTTLDDFPTREAFLRSKGYRITDVSRVNLRALHLHPLILKLTGEVPHSGFILTFPEEVLTDELRKLFDKTILFVDRVDHDRMIEYFSDLGKKELRLNEAGFIYRVEKENVEYVDVFHYDETRYGDPDPARIQSGKLPSTHAEQTK
jgi:hypothetical protein